MFERAVMGGFQAKHRKQGYVCHANLSPCIFHDTFLKSHSSFSSWNRGETFANGDFPYKYFLWKSKLLVFRTSLMSPVFLFFCFFFLNNRLRIMLMPKQHIWGCTFCCPSLDSCFVEWAERQVLGDEILFPFYLNYPSISTAFW